MDGLTTSLLDIVLISNYILGLILIGTKHISIGECQNGKSLSTLYRSRRHAREDPVFQKSTE
jgi:hypothetical protein